MSPEDNSTPDGTEGQTEPTEGSAPLRSAQEILLPAHDPIGAGNTKPSDIICTQPLPAADTLQELAGSVRPQRDLQKPTCLRCGLPVPAPDDRPRLSPAMSRLQGSKQSVNSNNSKKSRSSAAGSTQPAATPDDCCAGLLLACLSCQCSVLTLGLLEACLSCQQACCSSCCHACARCCSAVQEVPLEELNCHAHCHSVLFESCCEPTECLEFCLECCDICHKS